MWPPICGQQALPQRSIRVGTHIPIPQVCVSKGLGTRTRRRRITLLRICCFLETSYCLSSLSIPKPRWGRGWGITALRKDIQLLLPLNISLPTWPKYKIGPWFPPGLGELSWSCTDMLHTEADITRGRRTSHCWWQWGQWGGAQESTFTQTCPTWTLRSRSSHRALQEPMLRTWKKQELEEERRGVSWSDFTCPSTSRSQVTCPTFFWGDKRKWHFIGERVGFSMECACTSRKDKISG